MIGPTTRRQTTTTIMMRAVLAVRHYLKIFGEVVQPVTVSVMNVLVSTKQSPDDLLRDDSMFRLPDARMGDLDVPIPASNEGRAHRSVARTKRSFVPLHILILVWTLCFSIPSAFGQGPQGIFFPGPNTGSTSLISTIVNVKQAGAKGDGVTDDTTAIQKAHDSAVGTPLPGGCVYFPSGTYLVTSDLNWTSNAAPFCVFGDDPSSTVIQCNDAGGNCFDASGSDAYSIRNISFHGGTSSANAPRTLLLLARTANNQGFGHTLENVWTSSFGQYTIYDYGDEIAQWRDIRSNTPGVMISECNRAGVTSKFQTLVAPPTSMSVVNIVGGNLNAGGGINNCALYFDNACTNGLIHDVNIWSTFFGEMGGGGTALCDVAGGSNQILTLMTVIGTRLEAGDNLGTYRFINFANSYTEGITLIQNNLSVASGVTIPQPVMNFGNCVDNSQLQLDIGGGLMASGVFALTAPCGRGTRILDYPPEAMSPVLYLGDVSSGNHIGDSGNYIQWFDGGAPFYGHVDAGGMEANYRFQSVNGSTGGTVLFSMPGKATAYKVVVLDFSNYLNTGTVAQSISYPVIFNAVPTSFGTCPAGLVLTNGAQVSLPVSMASPFSGQCIISGM